MDFLPKELEDIIIDYKEDLEQFDKFKKAIKPINDLEKRYLYQYRRQQIETEIYVDNHYIQETILNTNRGREIKYNMQCELEKYIQEKVEIGDIDYALCLDWICLNKDLDVADYRETDYYNSFPEEFREQDREDMLKDFEREREDLVNHNYD